MIATPPNSFYAFLKMFWGMLFGTFDPSAALERRKERERCIAAQLRDKEARIVGNLPKPRCNLKIIDNLDTLKTIPNVAVVTGGNGMVGSALSQMLIDLGCQKVFSIDIAPASLRVHLEDKYSSKIEWCNVDITNFDKLTHLFDKIYNYNENNVIDAVYHTAALVGPFYKHELYYSVNYIGTVNMLNLCKEYKIGVFVDVSSPSTKYNGNDINGLDEQDFITLYKGTQFIHEYENGKFCTHEYARTKSLAEKEVFLANNFVLEQSSDSNKSVATKKLYTCIIAPHQIYGRNDKLFLPTVLETSKRVRIAGTGDYYVSFCNVENLCHAIILATRSLMCDKVNEMPVASGQLYFVTDDNAYNFWDAVDQALLLLQKVRAKAAGIKENEVKAISLREKFAVPKWLLLILSYFALVYVKITGNFVRLIPFSVRMTTINRYFCIGKIKRELGYKPLKSFEEGWSEVVQYLVNQKVQDEMKQK